MKSENLKSFIETQVDDAVELIFANAHGMAMTTSGDITPAQQIELDTISENLKKLVYNQVIQNLTEEQKKEYNICNSCNFDMGEGYENCGASEDGVCPECGTDSDDAAVHLRHCEDDACKYGEDNFPVAAAEEAAPETNFNTGYEGKFEGRDYEVINQGLSGNGNEHWRVIEFKDNGEKKSYHKSVLAKFQVEAPIKQWNVPVMRTGYAHTLIAVSARTEQEAIDLAIDEAGGESFSEKSSEYEAPDGAIEIKDSNI